MPISIFDNTKSPFRHFRLQNNLSIIFLDNHQSNKVAFQLWIRAGCSLEKKGEEGLFHFLEHLAFNARQRSTPFSRSIKNTGSTLNAQTSYFSTSFSVATTHDLSADILMYFLKMIYSINFNSQALESERNTVLSEMNLIMKNDTQNSFNELLNSVDLSGLFSHHPIGTIKSVSKTKLASLVELKSKFYNASNSLLIINCPEYQVDHLLKIAECTSITTGESILSPKPRYSPQVMEKGSKYWTYPLSPIALSNKPAFKLIALALSNRSNFFSDIFLDPYIGFFYITARTPLDSADVKSHILKLRSKSIFDEIKKSHLINHYLLNENESFAYYMGEYYCHTGRYLDFWDYFNSLKKINYNTYRNTIDTLCSSITSRRIVPQKKLSHATHRATVYISKNDPKPYLFKISLGGGVFKETPPSNGVHYAIACLLESELNHYFRSKGTILSQGFVNYHSYGIIVKGTSSITPEIHRTIFKIINNFPCDENRSVIEKCARMAKQYLLQNRLEIIRHQILYPNSPYALHTYGQHDTIINTPFSAYRQKHLLNMRDNAKFICHTENISPQIHSFYKFQRTNRSKENITNFLAPAEDTRIYDLASGAPQIIQLLYPIHHINKSDFIYFRLLAFYFSQEQFPLKQAISQFINKNYLFDVKSFFSKGAYYYSFITQIPQGSANRLIEAITTEIQQSPLRLENHDLYQKMLNMFQVKTSLSNSNLANRIDTLSYKKLLRVSDSLPSMNCNKDTQLFKSALIDFSKNIASRNFIIILC